MLQRYKIRLLSPLGTDLMSDSIFGHFCWGLRYLEGERFLGDFLGAFGRGRRAPVLFSSAFPEGTIPRPELPHPERSAVMAFARQKAGDDRLSLLKEIEKARAILSRRYISLADWQDLKGRVSWTSILAGRRRDDADGDPKQDEEIAYSNVISRRTGTVSEEGGLFARTRFWYRGNGGLHLYVAINDPTLFSVTERVLLEYIPATGFGADKSVGMGRLSVEKDESFDPSVFDCPSANARLLLSMTAFDGLERYESYYRLKTKYGRLGGGFASASPTGGEPRPFKKPILMYEPGAVIVTADPPDTADLLRGVHTDARICHCGVPLSIPFRWDREA